MNINSNKSNSFLPYYQDTTESLDNATVNLSKRLQNESLFEILCQEIKGTDPTLIQSIITQYPDEFKTELQRQDSNGNTVVHLAVKENNIEAMELILKTYSKIVSEILTVKNNEGKTPVCLTLMGKEKIAILSLFAEQAKDGFEAALIVTDNRDYLPIQRALGGNHLESIKLMLAASTEIRFKIFNRQDKKGNTLVHDVVNVNNIEALELILKANPMLVSQKLTVKNNEGQTPICLTQTRGEKIEILRCFSKHCKEGFEAALDIYDKKNWFSLHYALLKNHLESAKLILATSDRYLNNLSYWLDKESNTILHLAVLHNYFDIVDLLFKTSPLMVSCKLTRVNNIGNTPVHLAQSLKMFKMFAENAPQALKATLIMQNKHKETPLHCLIFENSPDAVEIFKFFSTTMQREFLNASSMRNSGGLSALDLIKRQRILNYREITKLFDMKIKSINKEISNIKALSHVLHQSGATELIIKKNKSRLGSLSLESWNPGQWFHMLAKDLEKISSNAIVPWNQELDCLETALHIASDSGDTIDVEYNRILEGKTTFLITGFKEHTVILLVWGNQMAICNLGSASKKTIELFHYDSKKIVLDDLAQIKNLKYQSKEAYKDLLFEKLPEKLGFYQTENDKVLEKSARRLEFQVVGNCSLVNPIGAIFAFNLLAETRGVDSDGRLGDENDSEVSNEALLNATNRHAKWLSLQEFAILERNVKGIENSTLETDHELIQTGLRIANLSLPDELMGELDKLTEIYLKSVDSSIQTDIKTDLCFWRSQRHKFNPLPSSLKASQIINEKINL